MPYSINTTHTFDREMKRLAKKYVSLKSEYIQLIEDLQSNPKMGIPLGGNLFKIKLAIASKGKGKSGGARIVTYFKNEKGEIYLLTIFDKSEKENIKDKEILNIIQQEL